MALIQCKDVSLAYDGTVVAEQLDFSVRRGEYLCIVGENGSGKTTLMKIILGFVRYLGLPADVICVLVCYCKDRAKQKGGLRNPSLRTIEKEAYAWAEQGIDTMEAAGAFIQGSTMDLSADGPIREPYAVYFQGGLTWHHAQLGSLNSLQKMVDAGLVNL